MKQSPIEEIIILANRGKTASIAQVVAAREQLAAKDAKLEEAIRIIAETNDWLVQNKLEGTAHQRQLVEFLIKVQS